MHVAPGAPDHALRSRLNPHEGPTRTPKRVARRLFANRSGRSGAHCARLVGHADRNDWPKMNRYPLWKYIVILVALAIGITYTLPRVIGMQKAQLMCLTGRRIKGEEALAWGLADEMVPLEDLRPAALRLAQEIAEAAPLAVVSTRATLRAGLAEAVKTQTDHELVEQTWLRGTKDFAEGVKSVNERRPGVFVGA